MDRKIQLLEKTLKQLEKDVRRSKITQQLIAESVSNVDTSKKNQEVRKTFPFRLVPKIISR